MKYISVFPEYPVSIIKIDELRRYRKKVINAQVQVTSLIRMLNSPSRIIKTVDGHHVNKSFVVGVRDYEDPSNRRSTLAKYERRNQVNLYVSMDLSTLDEVSGIIAVQKIARDSEACLERALTPCGEGKFVGILTDWNTTEKLDTLLEPGVMKVLDEFNLSHSFLAINRDRIKNYFLVREVGDESVENLIKPVSGV